MVLDLLAVGLDPERCALIRQSDFPEHAELMWIFDTVVPVSWLERTPTYKEKRDEGIDNSMGLLNYPVLQAADIVIYKASRVPVGQGPGGAPGAVARDRARLQPPLRPDLPRAAGRLHRCAGGARDRWRPQDEQVGRQHHPDLRRAG